MEKFDLTIATARKLWQTHLETPSLAPKGVVASPAFRAALSLKEKKSSES